MSQSYYVIACHKEGLDEQGCLDTIRGNVLKERGMTLGHCFPLTNQSVSIASCFYFYYNLSNTFWPLNLRAG